jgi:glycosyltransferase involved in cell wall biosynthesis
MIGVIRMKKILIITPSLSGGGAERTVLNISNYLDRKKFIIKIVSLRDIEESSYKHLLKKDIELININKKARNSFLSITKIINSYKPDIIFSTLPRINILAFISLKLSKNRKRTKLIVREANLIKKKVTVSPFLHFLLGIVYKKSNMVISLSRGIRKNLEENFGTKLNIKTIYNPIDLDTIDRLKEEKIENKNINFDKKFIFINCGRLAKQKNQKLLIESLYRANLPKEKWQLNLLGDGSNREELENLTKNYNLQNNINFLGFKKNPYKYMKNSDLFILSSLWEGFGHVVAESMACGTPVLSTDCPHGPREILDNGKYGWLVKNNDVKELSEKIRYLFYNQEEIKNMKIKVKERVEYFDAKNIVKQYEDAFLSLL